MNISICKTLLVLLIFAGVHPMAGWSQTKEQTVWDAVLWSPGGKIEFAITRATASEQNREKLFLVVGDEKIEVSKWEIDSGKMVIAFPHYDSRIEAKFNLTTKTYEGKWTKRQSKTKTSSLKFDAKLRSGDLTLNRKPNRAFSGRWKVVFKKSEDPAVGIFKVDEKGRATGTFLTTTGDYRFLGGYVDGDSMTLSCFDGAHAFLFKAKMDQNKKLSGTFWSRDSWKEGWTATKDPNAKLPDAFKITKWNSNVPLSKTQVKKLDGSTCSLADSSLLGKKGTIVYVFGTWCPNCHDAGEYLSKLDRKYGKQGIKIVGVAFELTEDSKRNVAQIKEYLKRHNASFTVVQGGRADLGKAEASKQFNLIDRIRSYPTTIFVNPDQSIEAIHTGFTGPATGKAYKELQTRFESLIEGWLK